MDKKEFEELIEKVITSESVESAKYARQLRSRLMSSNKNFKNLSSKSYDTNILTKGKSDFTPNNL
jgi:hypothetical protein